jgi:hypothetical protein
MYKQQRVGFALLRAFAALLLLLTSVGVAGASSGSATPRCDALTDFRINDFSRPIKIDNPWYPLVPGTQFILDGTINAGATPSAHRVVFTVTDLTKVLNGVTTRVLWDTDTNDGQLAESELAFQAQDNDGNVWVMGEYPEEYEAGVFVGAPSTWIGGLQGAKAGVLVPGHPSVGTPAFRQGYSPKNRFFDCGQVFAIGQQVHIGLGNFTNVLVINEWAPLEPTGGIQQKYYAPGVGTIQIGALNDPEAETLVLTGLKHLGPPALAAARAEALKLEQRAYQVSDVYRNTLPAELPGAH